MMEYHRTVLDLALVPPKRLEWRRKVALKREKEEFARRKGTEEEEDERDERKD